MVRVTDCKTEGSGSIPGGIYCFALIHRLPKNHKRFFARSFYGPSGRVLPWIISKGFYLEPLKVPAERWAEEPFKVLLRTFFWVYSHDACNKLKTQVIPISILHKKHTQSICLALFHVKQSCETLTNLKQYIIKNSGAHVTATVNYFNAILLLYSSLILKTRIWANWGRHVSIKRNRVKAGLIRRF